MASEKRNDRVHVQRHRNQMLTSTQAEPATPRLLPRILGLLRRPAPTARPAVPNVRW
jgi:hypothetical protein